MGFPARVDSNHFRCCFLLIVILPEATFRPAFPLNLPTRIGADTPVTFSVCPDARRRSTACRHSFMVPKQAGTQFN